MIRHLMVVAMLTIAALLPGCALSRAEQLARQSDKVESHLTKERDRLLAMSSAEVWMAAGNHTERLDHVNSLHTELTIADVARKAAPRLLSDPAQVETAYDILEEVYSTIDWNIPLAPSDAAIKPMPAQFGSGGLDFASLQPKTK